MADIEGVAIGEASNNLAEDADGFVLWEGSVSLNIIKKLTSFNVLKDEVSGREMSYALVSAKLPRGQSLQFTPVLPNIVQANDIGMLNQLHDGTFPFNPKRHNSRPCSIRALHHCVQGR